MSGEQEVRREAQGHSTPMDRSPPPKRQREPAMEEARVGETGHTAEYARTGNEGVSRGPTQGGQDQMRDEDDYDEDEVEFTNQTGTRYFSKPLYTNASELSVRSVVKRQGCDHCALVQNGDSLQHDRLGNQTIRARVGQGIGNGWDPGPPVWDPGTPIDG